jgi:putative Mg2+ transporter-C (MgtC) family protein
MPWTEFAINTCAALLLGSMIGLERQVHQRLAGLRTNALVTTGSAAFVALAAMVDHESSPTRIAGQVVSGIGFLGAGVIFKEGLNVRGLNTAATLWCSAAVGVLAGSGQIIPATLTAGMVLLINTFLRPLAGFLNRRDTLGTEVETVYRLSVICAEEHEHDVRSLVLAAVLKHDLGLRSIRRTRTREADDAVHYTIAAEVRTTGAQVRRIERAAADLSADPRVLSVTWRIAEDERANGERASNTEL